jgi:hypothetical protein
LCKGPDICFLAKKPALLTESGLPMMEKKTGVISS